MRREIVRPPSSPVDGPDVLQTVSLSVDGRLASAAQSIGKGATMSDDRYAAYASLKFARPAERILEITMDRDGRLNAADAVMHRDLAEVWRTVDADPDVAAVILRGAGKGFSAG